MTDDDDGPPTKHEGQLISITSTPVATPTPRSTSRALSPSPPRRLATLGHLCWPGEWLASFRIVISITLAFVSPISSLSEYPFLDLPRIHFSFSATRAARPSQPLCSCPLVILNGSVNLFIYPLQSTDDARERLTHNSHLRSELHSCFYCGSHSTPRF